MLNQILKELKNHSPFTLLGVLTGIIIMILCRQLSYSISYGLFYVLHPAHVFLSALVTAAMYKIHECPEVNMKCIQGKCNLWKLLLIGYSGSVGIATVSDSIIPYFFELLLDMPNAGIHIGFIEKWYLVNPLALSGIITAYYWQKTKFPHAAHVLLSTWASLFHILMAKGEILTAGAYFIIAFCLFIAVLIPCCVSDIIFPLLFVKPYAEKDGLENNVIIKSGPEEK